MAIAVTEDHLELARVARALLERQGGRTAARACLDGAPPPAVAGDPSWLGIHIPEGDGGQGYGLGELVVVVEELGRVLAPGAFLPTAAAAAVVSQLGTVDQRAALLPGLLDGTATAGLALRSDLVLTDGLLTGGPILVLGASDAAHLFLAVGPDLVVVSPDQEGVRIDGGPGVDPSRGADVVRCDEVEVPEPEVMRGGAADATMVARILAAAEAGGAARACVEMATGHAKAREQFGRPIGTFQAVKHRCADMLVVTELATALAWDAARAADAGADAAEARFAAAAAAGIAVPALLACAQANVQLHGGIGFTWEHDAHLFLRRAAALSSFIGAPEHLRREVTDATRAGVERRPSLAVEDAADQRTRARSFAATLAGVPEEERRRHLADSGFLMPHWPPPWGLGAGPAEQLIIDEELAGVDRPRMGISAWIALTLIQHGSDEQRLRWIRPSLEGAVVWCQLFSEPDAGSDAANILTRGRAVPGGWVVSGQKVWTSGAQRADLGFATVRTSSEGSKHAGVTTMAIDMGAEGVVVRPLRDITGTARFNEVFLDDVFVPEDDVVGEVGDGWRVARSTLGNERVSIGSDRVDRTALEARLPELLGRHAPDDGGFAADVGELIAERLAIQVLNVRQAARAVAGQEPGPEGNVMKLVVAEHEQRVSDLALRLAGSAAAFVDTEPDGVAHSVLYTRGLTIAGGTAEIVRNQIAERLLGLPRDPLLR